MANTKSFVEHVVDLLSTFEPVETKSMFGGASLMIDGMMVGFVDDDELFLKVDDESAPKFAAAGCKQFIYPTRNGPMVMGYYQPPAEALEDPRELRPWFDLAMGAAVRKQALKDAAAAEKRKRQEARAEAAAKKAAVKAPAKAVKKAAKKPAKAQRPPGAKAVDKATTKSAKRSPKPAVKQKPGSKSAKRPVRR